MPERVRVAFPVLMRFPLAPLMTPETVPAASWLIVSVLAPKTTAPAPDRVWIVVDEVIALMSKVAALETEEESAIDPAVERAKVPAEMVVVPEYVFTPERVRELLPALIRLPVPLME